MGFLTSLQEYGDWGLFILRLSIGIIFIYHGKMKWSMWKMEPSEQMPAQMLSLMKFLSIVEPLGGLALITGFLTQVAAVGLGVIMLGAINTKIKMMKVKFFMQDNTGWEFDFVLLFGCITLLLTGAGKIALDGLLFGI
ncbi:MAG: DoxX family protein [Fidelibacterota bacterium]